MGPSLPLSPASCLLPPARVGRSQPASSSLELLRPFVLRTAGSVFGLVNFLSLLFKLLSHKSSLRLPSGNSGLVLTLSNAACSSPFLPHLLVADAGVWGTSLLGIAFRHIICGFYLFFLPVRLPSKIRKFTPDPPEQGFPGVWKLPLLTPFPGRVSVHSSFVSLFIFYILSYLLSQTMGCFSGRLTTSASDQKLFCEVCSAFSCSFDEFVGDKVVSPSYSSTILAPPRLRCLLTCVIFLYQGANLCPRHWQLDS